MYNINKCNNSKHIEKRLTLKATAEEYLRHVTDSAMLKLSLIARVKETGQICANQECYRLRVPDILLKVINTKLRWRQVIVIHQLKPIYSFYLSISCIITSFICWNRIVFVKHKDCSFVIVKYINQEKLILY